MNTLWQRNSKCAKAAAVCMGICFLTGARCIDALRVNTNRMQQENTKYGNFLIMKLNTSKTNMTAKYHEQLTYRMSENNIIKLENWIEKWKQLEKPVGNLFSDKYTSKQIVHKFKWVSKKLNFKEIITGHSGRNSMVLELYKAGVDDEAKKIFMRWRANSTMPLHYRSILLETSLEGAAQKIYQNNFNQE